MVSGFWMIKDYTIQKNEQTNANETVYENHMYYFGGKDDGSMKTGSQSVKDDAGDTYKFYFSTKTDKRGIGITGNQGGKLYYYGRLIQATDYKYQLAEVNGYYFIVNSNGSIQHGQISFAEKANTVEKDELIENGGDEHPDGYTDEAYKNAVLGVYSYTGDEDTPMEAKWVTDVPTKATFLQDVDKDLVIDDIRANGVN